MLQKNDDKGWILMKKCKQLTVEICEGTSCHLLGSEDLFESLKRLPRKIQDAVHIQGVNCLQSCGKGPNVRINGLILTDVTPEQLLRVIEANFNCEKESI